MASNARFRSLLLPSFLSTYFRFAFASFTDTLQFISSPFCLLPLFSNPSLTIHPSSFISLVSFFPFSCNRPSLSRFPSSLFPLSLLFILSSYPPFYLCFLYPYYHFLALKYNRLGASPPHPATWLEVMECIVLPVKIWPILSKS